MALTDAQKRAQKKYYEANKERILAYKKKYWQLNKHKYEKNMIEIPIKDNEEIEEA